MQSPVWGPFYPSWRQTGGAGGGGGDGGGGRAGGNRR